MSSNILYSPAFEICIHSSYGMQEHLQRVTEKDIYSSGQFVLSDLELTYILKLRPVSK